MNSLILSTATRYLLPLLALYSIFMLLQGHNKPGGGFIGGLLAASSVAICALAFNVATAGRILPLAAHQLIGFGLLAATVSGLWALAWGEPYLKAGWLEFELPGLGELHVGTPLLFDIGVYSVVTGVVLMILFNLAED